MQVLTVKTCKVCGQSHCSNERPFEIRPDERLEIITVRVYGCHLCPEDLDPRYQHDSRNQIRF